MERKYEVCDQSVITLECDNTSQPIKKEYSGHVM